MPHDPAAETDTINGRTLKPNEKIIRLDHKDVAYAIADYLVSNFRVDSCTSIEISIKGESITGVRCAVTT